MVGFCRPTEYGGDCLRGDEGAWPGVKDLSACITRCKQCARCAVLSYSRAQDDCSWYAWCDLYDTRRPPTTGRDYVTLAVRPVFAPLRPAERGQPTTPERHATQNNLAIATLAIGAHTKCGLVHWCEHVRRFTDLLPRSWAITTVIIGDAHVSTEDACGGHAVVLAVDPELLDAYRHCRRERRKGVTLREHDRHLDMAMIKWQLFKLTQFRLLFFCDVDISLTTREWLAQYHARPVHSRAHRDDPVPRWRMLIRQMTSRPLCTDSACRDNASWTPAFAAAGRDHSSPVNTGMFFLRPSLPLYRDGLVVLRSCEFTGASGWQHVGSPRSLLASGVRAWRVDGTVLDGAPGNLSQTEALVQDTWLFAAGEVDQGFFWYMAYLRHDAGAYLDPAAASSHRPMHWWGAGCSGKPWATGSLQALFRTQPMCLKYRYGYLTRTLIAQPNASRCASVLWAQRREIEELGAANPGEWGASVGMPLL